jgi:glycosyltransferase involved in cell wall biosynthesis
MSMRILLVIPSLGPLAGGANVSCFELGRALTKLGAQVSIYTMDRDLPPEVHARFHNPVILNGVSVSFFRALGPSRYPVSFTLAKEMSRIRGKFDVVHIHSLYRFHLPLAAYFCRKYGIPYVVKPHGSLDPFLYERGRLLKSVHEWLFDRNAYLLASAVQFTADDELKLAASTGFFGRSKLVTAKVIPNGVVIPEGVKGISLESKPESIFLKFPKIGQGKKLVLFLGRINFKKGLDILVPAFARVHRRYPNAHLVIAGPDSEGLGLKVKTWLEDEGVAEHATFTGMVLGVDKAALFQAADVFVLSSYTENFGVAIIEAMGMGVPVVISNNVNIWREVADARAGIVTNCDVGEVADAIEKILGDPVESKNMGFRGMQVASEKFDWKVIAQKMLNVYETLVRK